MDTILVSKILLADAPSGVPNSNLLDLSISQLSSSPAPIVTILYVLNLGPRDDVGRITAARIVAGVATSWLGPLPVVKEVRHAMSLQVLASHLELTVTEVKRRSLPRPTLIHPTNLDTSPEAFARLNEM